uniref:Uncharacterized protein n=1 Tax=Pararge aegeria TaxID=116150 RepID=S4PW22_9NEOP
MLISAAKQHCCNAVFRSEGHGCRCNYRHMRTPTPQINGHRAPCCRTRCLHVYRRRFSTYRTYFESLRCVISRLDSSQAFTNID